LIKLRLEDKLRRIVMTGILTQTRRLLLLTAIITTTAALANAQSSDSGSVNLAGTVSGYVEVRAGGAATLANNTSGGITNNKVKGDKLNTPTTMIIDFGEVGPTNTNSFVTATVPLRLRSNVSYTLKTSASAITGVTDASSVTLADIGFGITTATRDAGAGVAAGADTIVATASGDPTLGANGSIDVVTGRYIYNASHSLANYTSSTTVLTGPRIMSAMVPTGNTNGLVVTSIFSIKPQFFTPGSFSTSVTFTISNP
jgi:hypothetical protein